MLRPLLLLLLWFAAPAASADRTLSIGSFERVRVEGAFRVSVATGRSASARVSGGTDAPSRVEVRLDGTTLVVRNPLERWQPVKGSTPSPVTVTLTTPVLAAAHVIGGGALAVTGARAQRLDLSVAGAGEIAVTGVDVEQANATVIGNGRIALTGRAGRARLLVNGAGRIEADALQAGDLTVRVDGPGETTARARYTASVTNSGLGRVTVAGAPKCAVRSGGGGPVVCGVAPR